jgi:hypothetical protein
MQSTPAVRHVPGSNGLGVAFSEGHAADPVPLSP